MNPLQGRLLGISRELWNMQVFFQPLCSLLCVWTSGSTPKSLYYLSRKTRSISSEAAADSNIYIVQPLRGRQIPTVRNMVYDYSWSTLFHEKFMTTLFHEKFWGFIISLCSSAERKWEGLKFFTECKRKTHPRINWWAGVDTETFPRHILVLWLRGIFWQNN